jgi:hypothetical protein
LHDTVKDEREMRDETLVYSILFGFGFRFASSRIQYVHTVGAYVGNIPTCPGMEKVTGQSVE